MMEFKLTYELDKVRCDALVKFDLNEDTTEVIKAAATIIQMGAVAREEGLLALEAEYPQYELPDPCEQVPKFKDEFEKGLYYLVDGTDPKNLAESMINRYWASKYQGNDALRSYIIIRGMILIQTGANPRVTRELFKSLLPQSLHNTFEEYESRYLDEWSDKRIFRILKRYEEWEPVLLQKEENRELIQAVEKKVLSLSEDLFWRVYMQIETDAWVRCLVAFSKDCRDYIFENLLEGPQVYLKERMMNVPGNYEENIAGAIIVLLKHISFEEDGGWEAALKKAGLWEWVLEEAEHSKEIVGRLGGSGDGK